MKKKALIKIIIALVITLSLLLIKIPVPTFFFRPTDIYLESIQKIVDDDRSIWIYRPLVDELIIEDSIRKLNFTVQQACAYNAQACQELYIRAFLPWAKVHNFKNLCFFQIWFDQMHLREKRNSQIGIWFSVDTISNNFIRRNEVGWDNIKDNFSCYGVRIVSPLPDTLYFTVWGYSDFYMDNPIYRTLSEDQRYSILDRPRGSDKIKNLGEIIFVKKDSIISKNKKNESILYFGNQ